MHLNWRWYKSNKDKLRREGNCVKKLFTELNEFLLAQRRCSQAPFRIEWCLKCVKPQNQLNTHINFIINNIGITDHRVNEKITPQSVACYISLSVQWYEKITINITVAGDEASTKKLREKIFLPSLSMLAEGKCLQKMSQTDKLWNWQDMRWGKG